MAIKNKVIVQARLKFLKRAVLDFFEGTYAEHKSAFYSYSEVLETLALGIDREYLERVEFIGRKDKVIKNILAIKIDWTKHRVLCTSMDGKDIELDGTKSVAEQVSAALPLLSRFISDSLKSEVITSVGVHYSGRVDLDAQARATIRSEMGLVSLTDEDRQALRNFSKDNLAVEIVPEKLQELSITFRSHTKIKFDDESE